MSETQKQHTDPKTEAIVDEPRNPQAGTQEPSTGAPDTSTRPRFTFRRSTLRLGHTHQGFGHTEKPEAPEPQSTPILVLGEVSAPHPSNCKHKGPGRPDQTETEDDEQATEGDSTGVSRPRAANIPSPGGEEASARPLSLTHAGRSSQVENTENHIAKLEHFSPVSAFTLPSPSIRISPPPQVSGSLGTRAILSTSTKSSKMVSSRGAETSKTPVPTPGGLGDGVPKQLPAEVSHVGDLPTDILAAGDLPISSLPALDLPSLPAPALQLEMPPVLAVLNDLDNGSNPPHAKKCMRRKLKQKARPRLEKARKLILKKKILSVILGKQLTAILEPHLNATTSQMSDLADNGPPVPVPTPL